MKIQVPPKAELKETIRVIRSGLKAVEHATFDGFHAVAIAELMNFLKMVEQSASAQYATMPDDAGNPDAQFGSRDHHHTHDEKAVQPVQGCPACAHIASKAPCCKVFAESDGEGHHPDCKLFKPVPAEATA